MLSESLCRLIDKRNAKCEMSFTPPVTIIINTDGRAHSLSATLNSLRFLDYPNFEVCVVYGPTNDGTKELLDSFGNSIKVGHCPTRNLSQSRNISLMLAAGEIVAFLDDDSIPEPEWLSKVVMPFADPKVAASGGFLVDHTGVGYQWRFGTANRMGLADESWDRAAPELNFPFSANFPHVMANSAFRLAAVISIGGFDEQYAYFLDETDLICRLVDAGWRIAQLAGASVHHKFKPSHIRNENRILTSWYTVVKSKIYFSIVNSQGHNSIQSAIHSAKTFVADFEKNLEWAIANNLLTADYRKKFEDEIEEAWKSGLLEGLSGNRLLLAASENITVSEFRPFDILVPRVSDSRLTICFLTQTYPPASVGGIGRYVHQLARGIAKLGHQIHVLTKADEYDTVDFEDGVWVHRIKPRRALDLDSKTADLPPHIWDYSSTMLDELRKIRRGRNVDVVYAPIWDCEGIAVLLSGEFPLVTSLQTTLKFWLASHPHMLDDKSFMGKFVGPMLHTEKLLFANSVAIHAISQAIVEEIEKAYSIKFNSAFCEVVPLGQEDWSELPAIAPASAPAGSIRLLYVGRLEERKGIDVLLSALEILMPKFDNLYVDIVGNDQIPGSSGVPYRVSFEEKVTNASFRGRITFHGEVADSVLRGFYRACDIFVAPSRFESFGLILLEAMMFGKAVIACRAGGMTEVLDNGVTGLLAEPGDVFSLEGCINRLVTEPKLRRQMGLAGRRRYEELFTPERMSEGVLAFLTTIIRNRN